MAMAATNQPLPGLQVTAPDEDMEISDYERNADDIDIDIDLTVDPSHHEDENMDDDRSEHDSKDDVMLDGDGNDDDGMMQDNVSVPDEHLTDASEVGYVDMEVKEAPQAPAATEPVDVHVQDSTQAEDFIDYDDTPAAQAPPAQDLSAPQAAPDAVDRSVVEQTQFPDSENSGNQGNNVQLQSSESSSFPQASGQDQISASGEAAVEEATSATSGAEDPVAVSDSVAQPAGEPRISNDSLAAHSEKVLAEPVLDSQTVSVTENGPHPPETAEFQNQSQVKGSPHDDQIQRNEVASEFVEQQAEPEHPAQQPNEALDFSTLPFDFKNDDAESQPANAAVSLHPVVVVYQGDEISLFPPHGSDTSDSFYFLQDESMANESIRSLLQACRQVLGETVRDEDELELDIAELGLCVSEDSGNAANTSFSQVLDVYLQLHQLDGHQNPGPLYMTLNTKTRFSARLDALLAAIADGRGMSQLSFLEDVADEDAFAGSEIGPDEHSVHQVDEQDGGEPAGDSLPEHAPEQEASYEQGTQEKLPTESDHEAAYGSTATQQPQAQVQVTLGADHQEEPSRPEQNVESESTHQDEPQGYVSPKTEDLPEYESSDEGDVPTTQNDNGLGDSSRTDVCGPDYSRQNDQINYDDGDTVEEVRDDVSLRSSTLQGDNTPVALGEGRSQRGSNASVVSTGVGDGHQDETQGERGEDIPPAPNAELLQQAGIDTQASDFAAVEENQSLEQAIGQGGSEGVEDGAEASLEEELERELEGPPQSFDLPEGGQGMPDEGQYTVSYEEGEEYEFGQDASVRERQDGKGLYEKFVVVEAQEAYDGSDAPDGGQAADGQDWSHGDGFDDAEAEQTVENNPDDNHSELEHGLEDDQTGQAQPNAHASEEDELDTIDYDDEELSRSPSAQHDEAAVASPSSGKRGWEELGQDDEDEDSEQAPKKVKSE